MMEEAPTARNQRNPLNTTWTRPTLHANEDPQYERYERMPERNGALQFSPQSRYSLSLADKQYNADLPSTQQRFGKNLDYSSRENFQEIPYDFLDQNRERFDGLSGKRLGKRTVEQAVMNANRGFRPSANSMEAYIGDVTEGNWSISPQLLQRLQAEGYETFEILDYFNEFAERQKIKNLLLFIIVLLLFGLLIGMRTPS